MAVLYSDKAVISKTDCGFILTFMTNKTEVVKIDEVVAQVGMSPKYAKTFLVHLYTEVARFERQFGEIKMPPPLVTELKSSKPPIGFSSE